MLTQFLQFDLGYTALQAGVRVLPAAGAIALMAPLSAPLVRVAGTKLTASAGLLIVAAGLWQLCTATVSSTYTSTVAGMILLGVGAGPVIPSATASVMGSLPRAAENAGQTPCRGRVPSSASRIRPFENRTINNTITGGSRTGRAPPADCRKRCRKAGVSSNRAGAVSSAVRV